MWERLMTEDKNIDLVRDLIKVAHNGHDPDALKDYLAEGFTAHTSGLGTTVGRDNYTKSFVGFGRALPDSRATELDVVASGDKVCMRFVLNATHKGEMWGIAATGRPVSWEVTVIFRIEGDRVAEQWAVEDWSALLRDIGFFTPPF
jgi:predicted ester cyclase